MITSEFGGSLQHLEGQFRCVVGCAPRQGHAVTAMTIIVDNLRGQKNIPHHKMKTKNTNNAYYNGQYTEPYLQVFVFKVNNFFFHSNWVSVWSQTSPRPQTPSFLFMQDAHMLMRQSLAHT